MPLELPLRPLSSPQILERGRVIIETDATTLGQAYSHATMFWLCHGVISRKEISSLSPVSLISKLFPVIVFAIWWLLMYFDSNGARIAQGSGTMLSWKEGDPFLVDAENRRPNTCSASVEFKVQSDRNKASQRGIPVPVTVLTGQSQRGNPQQ